MPRSCSSGAPSSSGRRVNPIARRVSNARSASRRSSSTSSTSAPQRGEPRDRVVADRAHRGLDGQPAEVRAPCHAQSVELAAQIAGEIRRVPVRQAATVDRARRSPSASAPDHRPSAPSGPRPTRRPTRRPSPACATSPGVGRSPTTLLNDAGLRMLPPWSEPSASGSMPAASAAPAPPLLPPADRSSAPRVARRPEHLVERVRPGAHLRGVGLADHDRAGRSQTRDEQAVDLRHVLGKELRPVRGADPGRVDQILDRDRQPVQRPDRLTSRRPLVGGIGLGQRRFGPEADDRVDLGVDRIDPFQMRGDDLARGQLPLPDRARQFARCPPMQLHAPRLAQVSLSGARAYACSASGGSRVTMVRVGCCRCRKPSAS